MDTPVERAVVTMVRSLNKTTVPLVRSRQILTLTIIYERGRWWLADGLLKIAAEHIYYPEVDGLECKWDE
jgi:hypothetical protein